MFYVSKTIARLLAVQSTIEKLEVPPEEVAMDCLYYDATFMDDVTGKTLDKAKAIEARKKKFSISRPRACTQRRSVSQG